MRKPSGTRQKQNLLGVAFDAEGSELVVASIAPGGGLSVTRARAGEPFRVEAGSAVMTPLRGWSSHTDNARLQVSASDDDETILGRIIEGAQGRGGTSELRYTFGRTNDGRIVLTQALKIDVEDTHNVAGGWLARQTGRGAQPLPVATDTPARCLARLWLSGPVDRPEIPTDGAVAFLVIGEDGYATALWSHGTGLVYETSERFKQGAEPAQIADHVRNKVANFISPDTIGRLNSSRQANGTARPLGDVSHLVVSCCDTLRGAMAESLSRSEQLSSVSVERITLAGGGPDAEADLVTALAVGAAVGAAYVPSADLALDLPAQLEAVRTRKREAESVGAARGRRAAAVTMAAPLVAAVLFLACCAFWRFAVRTSLEIEVAREKATAAQLKQANADFEAAKTNFSVIKNLIGQISNLRSRQPDTYRLLAELNSRWPRGAGSWYVSGVENVGNNLVVKGRTKDEQAITTFVSNLENSEGMFSGVTEDHKQQQQPQQQLFAVPQQQQQSGVYEFTVKATYTPQRTTAAQGGRQ